MVSSNNLAVRAAAGLVFLMVLAVLTTQRHTLSPRPAFAEETGPQPSTVVNPPTPPAGSAELPPDQQAKLAEAERAAKTAIAAKEEPPKSEGDSKQPAAPDAPSISLLDLYRQGGPLMYPITAMSVIVVIFGLERAFALRRRKVLPPRLIQGIQRLARQKGGFDPQRAYRLCQQYPSTAANVIKSTLMRVGRPNAELEQARTDSNQREANRLYRNVRWLNLSASVTPLMGLLGTVQGMILAFFVTAHLPVGANKAESLAEGIYMALVTTFGGLTVAIPAAILSHFFEGRIQRLFGELDELMLALTPQLERFEGKVRVSKEQADRRETDGLTSHSETMPEGMKIPHPAAARKKGS